MNGLQQQDAFDEAAAHALMERSVMCDEVTLTGATARSIARYISNLEVESDNDLAGVQALSKELMATSEELVKQNAELKIVLEGERKDALSFERRAYDLEGVQIAHNECHALLDGYQIERADAGGRMSLKRRIEKLNNEARKEQSLLERALSECVNILREVSAEPLSERLYDRIANIVHKHGGF